MKLLFLLVCVSVTVSAANSADSNLPPGSPLRIIRGKPATKEDFPPFAEFSQYKDEKPNETSPGLTPGPWLTHFCGGTIIHRQWVLTACHCFHLGHAASRVWTQVRIRVGSTNITDGKPQEPDERTYELENVTFHPECAYSPEYGYGFRHDIMLVKIKGEFESHRIARVQAKNEEMPGALATALGHGYHLPYDGGTNPILLKLTQKICPEDWNTTLGLKQFSTGWMEPGQFYCHGLKTGQGGGHGDSGGPLIAVSNKVVIGVLSWGKLSPVGEAEFFARVPLYVDWIEKTIGDKLL